LNDFLPTEDGWRRIYTLIQLYLDGYAPKIIVSGGGSKKVTVAVAGAFPEREAI
jgi:hypothetical protein